MSRDENELHSGSVLVDFDTPKVDVDTHITRAKRAIAAQ